MSLEPVIKNTHKAPSALGCVLHSRPCRQRYMYSIRILILVLLTSLLLSVNTANADQSSELQRKIQEVRDKYPEEMSQEELNEVWSEVFEITDKIISDNCKEKKCGSIRLVEENEEPQ